MSRRTPSLGLLAGTLALSAGCGGGLLEGPPRLRLGRDECAECGMLVSEERCSGAILVERGGRREHLIFDDIGCMLDHQREGDAEIRSVEAFVHDHSTKEWVPAASAVFLMADGGRLSTPMGSGLIAFAGGAGAARAQQDLGGEILDYAGAAEARRAGAVSRPGGP